MTYLGYDVLELDFNRKGPVEDRLDRDFALLDPETGKRLADEITVAPAGTRTFVWTAFGRAEIATMRTFLEARKGRAVPFWLPTYQFDLALAEDLLTSATIATIEWVRYTQQMLGTTGARRHIALWTEGIPGGMSYHLIEDADDPGNGTTESLTITPGATTDYDADATVISFLKFCRLESDQVRISYPDTDHAEAEIQIRELPLEAPTTAS